MRPTQQHRSAPVSAAAPSLSAGATLPSAVDLSNLSERPAAKLDFVLPGLLAGTVGGLIGPGGVGKSFLALQIATSMATGYDLVGMRLGFGAVLYLAGEDYEEIQVQRLQAMSAVMPKGMSLHHMLDLRPVTDDALDIMEPGWFEQVAAAAYGKRLVVLDTLSRFHNLDENSAKDMKMLLAQLERLARRTGAAVLFLHHTSKISTMAGQVSSQQAARGSSVLVDNARWASFLAGMSEAEARQFGVPESQRGSLVRWNTSKLNYSAGGRPDIWYQRNADGVLCTHSSGASELPKRDAAPVPELPRLPTDAAGRPLFHYPPRRGTGNAQGATAHPAPSQAQTVQQSTQPRLKELHAGSTMAEREEHARIMASSSQGSATGAFGGKW